MKVWLGVIAVAIAAYIALSAIAPKSTYGPEFPRSSGYVEEILRSTP